MKGYRDVPYLLPVFVSGLDDDPGKLVQAGECNLWGWQAMNDVAAVTYIQLFNAAALVDVTLGTTTPDAWFALITSKPGRVILQRPINFPLGLCAFSTTAPTGLTGAASTITFFIG